MTNDKSQISNPKPKILNPKSQRPYFFWGYDITEEEVREILRGGNEVEKAWVITRILEHAKWEDNWRYFRKRPSNAFWRPRQVAAFS